MSIHFVKGDMLEAKLDYYCHQVNCQNAIGAGISGIILCSLGAIKTQKSLYKTSTHDVCFCT